MAPPPPPPEWSRKIPIAASLVLAACRPGGGNDEGETSSEASSSASSSSSSSGSTDADTGTTGGNEVFLGRWNLVNQGYGGASYDFPRVYTYTEYGQVCTYVSAIDLDLAPAGQGAFTDRYENSCYGGGEYDSELEWELDGTTLNFYMLDDGGYYGETGAPTTGGPLPERVLFLSCDATPTVLDCVSPDTAGLTATFARPACSDDTQCPPDQACVYQQCVSDQGQLPKVERPGRHLHP